MPEWASPGYVHSMSPVSWQILSLEPGGFKGRRGVLPNLRDLRRTSPWSPSRLERIVAVPGRTKKTKRLRDTPQGPKGEGRSLFRELMSGVEAMREHREGRLTLRTHEVAPIVPGAARARLR